MVVSLHPAEMEHTLTVAGELCGCNGGILVGLDLMQDARRLERAYNDRLGIAAAFNLNILERLNRELDTDFNLCWFQHRSALRLGAWRNGDATCQSAGSKGVS